MLIADDYLDAALSLSMLVKIWGHEVWVASNGAAALEHASDHPIDVFVLDIGMPMLNGYVVAQQLRRHARFEKALLIATTGWADQAHRILGEEAGFDHYLIKPLDPSVLEKLLTREWNRLSQSAAVPGATSKTDKWKTSARDSEWHARRAPPRDKGMAPCESAAGV